MNNTNTIKCHNKCIEFYANSFLEVFRKYCKNKFSIKISGLGCFINKSIDELAELLYILDYYGFTIEFIADKDTIETLQITCNDNHTGKTENYACNIGNLLSIIELSSKTDIPIAGIMIIQIVSRLVCHYKILQGYSFRFG